MLAINTIKDLILDLEKGGNLDLKISEDRLSILINRYLTGQETYKPKSK